MNRLLAPDRVNQIKEQANQILGPYLHIQDPLERVVKIAKDNNINILQSELYEMSGALRKENDGWKIYVNSSDSPRRQLFTIAHELGHFFVHKTECDEFIDGQLIARDEKEKYGLQELEANEFAGNLIMPESELRKRIANETLTEQRVIELATQFNVSSLAMATRLKNLNYDVPGLRSKAS